ncbi:putative lipid II flippase FtsW [Candidatus Uhrbacteria bacterium]|nr:putative lipid II flippase FtsW [Candidatus Uhrbacteria bacterium]
MRLTLRQRLLALDPVLVGLALGLTLLGLAVLMSATGPVAFQRYDDSLFFVKRQLLQGVLPGMTMFLFFAFIDYRIWKRLAFPALVATFGLLLLPYIPGIGVEVGGSHSWAAFGPLRFQPSEIVKFTFLIYLAAWFSGRTPERMRDWHELIPFGGALGAVCLLLIAQPDTGTTAVIAGMSLFLYVFSGAPMVWFIGMSAGGAAIIAMLIKFSPYRAARFMTFLHPELDPQGIGYHINQAILAVGSGGFLGLGFGKSRQKYLYLPEVEADSIFAVMAEELGFFLTMIVLLLFVAFVWRCFVISRKSKDRFGSLLAAGFGCWIAVQAWMNIASMIGLMPITGVTLPFISHGGTSLTILLAASGLVAGITRTNRET